jgi:RNA polymerase sigma factor (sigma-70 family)
LRRVAAETPDRMLLEGVRNGDARAWAELVERHTPRLWAIARAFGCDQARAEDVIQTCWLRLIDHASEIRNPDAVGAWLRQVARHEALRIAIDRDRTTLDPNEPWQAMPTARAVEDDVVGADTRARLNEAFARLSPRCQQHLRLLFDDELSYRDIALLLGRPISSLGPTRKRCVEELRKLFDPVGTKRGVE